MRPQMRCSVCPPQAEPVAPKPVLGGLRRTASGNLVPVADDAPIQ